jgi:hypothetical protein
MLTDLLIDEPHMTSRLGSIDRDILCDHILGLVPLTDAYRSDCIMLTWLNINFKTSSADATKN